MPFRLVLLACRVVRVEGPL